MTERENDNIVRIKRLLPQYEHAKKVAEDHWEMIEQNAQAYFLETGESQIELTGKLIVNHGGCISLELEGAKPRSKKQGRKNGDISSRADVDTQST